MRTKTLTSVAYGARKFNGSSNRASKACLWIPEYVMTIYIL